MARRAALGVTVAFALAADVAWAARSEGRGGEVLDVSECDKNVKTVSGSPTTANATKDGHVDTPDGFVPAPCKIPNSNKQSGPLCDCLPGYKGTVAWSGPVAYVKTGEGETELNYESCPPATCTVQNAEGEGPECKCKDFYTGEITWTRDDQKKTSISTGECVAKPCTIENSNGVDGPGCKCADKFVNSEITWDRTALEHKGECEPAPCGLDNMNGQKGEAAACKDGFSGDITWTQGTCSGECKPAECNIPNTNGDGLSCKCKEYFVGDITWTLTTPDGTCTAATCEIEHSNGQPGAGCKCKPGYTGTLKWDPKGKKIIGVCEEAVCAIDHTNSTKGPYIGCADGYSGDITWIEDEVVKDTYKCSGTCTLVACPGGTTRDSEDTCACPKGYVGRITFSGDTATGECNAAKCEITDSNGQAGPSCACKAGYSGTIEWVAESQSWFGGCEKARCDVANSNNLDGPDCMCTKGYQGTITWDGATPSGPCEPADCDIPNSVGSGLDCKCKHGYSGHIEWEGSTPSVLNSKDQKQELCEPVPCKIQFSTNEAGPSCKCLPGYKGTITWAGEEVAGNCQLAECNVENCLKVDGNCQKGTACKCMDGFYATKINGMFSSMIAWNDDQPADTCKAVPCNVENSNKAAGPECRCLDGFTGTLTWNGVNVEGTCTAAACNIEGSNKERGLDCKCIDGHKGDITWSGNTPTVTVDGTQKNVCPPVTCEDPHGKTNGEPGSAAKCGNGFQGTVTWNKEVCNIDCTPVPCPVYHTNGKAGKECKCDEAHGYFGKIEWEGSVLKSPDNACKEMLVDISALMNQQDAFFFNGGTQFQCCISKNTHDAYIFDTTQNRIGEQTEDVCPTLSSDFVAFDTVEAGRKCKVPLSDLLLLTGGRWTDDQQVTGGLYTREELIAMLHTARQLQRQGSVKYTQITYEVSGIVYETLVKQAHDYSKDFEEAFAAALGATSYQVPKEFIKVSLNPAAGTIHGFHESTLDMAVTIWKKQVVNPATTATATTTAMSLKDALLRVNDALVSSAFTKKLDEQLKTLVSEKPYKSNEATTAPVKVKKDPEEPKDATEAYRGAARCCCTVERQEDTCDVLRESEVAYLSTLRAYVSGYNDPVCPQHFNYEFYEEMLPKIEGHVPVPDRCSRASFDFVKRMSKTLIESQGDNPWNKLHCLGEPSNTVGCSS